MTNPSISNGNELERFEQLKFTFETIGFHRTEAEEHRDAFAIDSAVEVAPITQQLFDPVEGVDVENLTQTSNISSRELLRIRKVAEVYENQWQLRLPSEPLWKAAQTAGTISTIGGIVIALNGVNETASAIESTLVTHGESAIQDSQIRDFYFASGVFIGELVLMSTPISANFAFQTTGRLHSYVLWRRFHNHRAAYRILLHHLYYFVNCLPSLALHGAGSAGDSVESVVDSIVYIIQTSWNTFSEPSFLADITSVELSSGLIGQIFDLRIEDIRRQLGDGFDQLRNYVVEILRTIESHYANFYESLVDASQREIAELVAVKLLRTSEL